MVVDRQTDKQTYKETYRGAPLLKKKAEWIATKKSKETKKSVDYRGPTAPKINYKCKK